MFDLVSEMFHGLEDIQAELRTGYSFLCSKRMLRSFVQKITFWFLRGKNNNFSAKGVQGIKAFSTLSS